MKSIGLFIMLDLPETPIEPILFAGAILFHIVTLPVEFDASSRALRLIDELGILQGEENRGARSVLNAAAWTYVATAIYSALQLVQLW
jgi:Zn-dependent membrane protease YugP